MSCLVLKKKNYTGLFNINASDQGKSFFLPSSFPFLFQTGFHVAHDGLELAVQLRVTVNLSSCLRTARAGLQVCTITPDLKQFQKLHRKAQMSGLAFRS